MKYLGTPLFSSRLKLESCLPIIGKIRKHPSRWKSSNLLYAGRVELINYSLFSLHIFWSSRFTLPKSCIVLPVKHIRNFLWSDFDSKNRLKTISWKTISSPLELGGQGINSIKAIADAALRRQTWAIASRKDTILVKWIRDKCTKERNFRDINLAGNCS